VALPELQKVTTQQLSIRELAALRAFLNEAFDDDFPDEDWDHCLGGVHVVLRDGDSFISHAAVVERQLVADDRPLHTGYVEGVATRSQSQGQGHGSRVMNAVGQIISGGFEMGALGTGRIHFYARLGWELWQGPTSVSAPTGPQRTPEEDGSVMVLRTEATRDLDLTTELMCDPRAGEVW
jgi:aminoglycoside 2'-N-acetyltransferase I